jgi:hypothetical protein
LGLNKERYPPYIEINRQQQKDIDSKKKQKIEQNKNKKP